MGRNRGLILVFVLWIVAIVSVGMYAALFSARTEFSLSGTWLEQERLRQVAMSGVEYGVAVLLEDPTPYDTVTDPWYENEALFRQVSVGDDGVFSIVRPTADGGLTYGILDEAALIHLNRASVEHLRQLPGMDGSKAQAVVDWRDEDRDALPEGAEDEYYLSLVPGYRSKNAPFETVRELLLVRDFTPAVLFGKDRNLNHQVDVPEESDPEATTDLGVYPWVTVWSRDRNTDIEDRPRVHLNDASDAELRSVLQASFDPAKIQTVLNFRRSQKFQSVAQLSGLPDINAPEVGPVYDRLTVDDKKWLAGQVNVNTAPKRVLMALAGLAPETLGNWPEGVMPPEALQEEDVDRIVQARASGGPGLSSVGWLFNVLSEPKFRSLAPWVTVRSLQFRIDVVATLRDRPLYMRLQAVVEIDRKAKTARVLHLRDLSDLRIRLP